MAKAAITEVIDSGVLTHPAVVAWRKLAPGCETPNRIMVLKNRKHSSVYLLNGAGPRGAAVVAKRCRPAGAAIERTVYEDILPALQVPALQIYGCLGVESESATGQACWLFLEDAKGENYSYALHEHRMLAARWLGAMHSSAVPGHASASLPSRGPGYYLDMLRTVRGAVHRSFENPALNVEHLRVLEAILAQYDSVESHWSQIAAICDRMPQTLVHGDLAAKNVRVTTGRHGLSLMVMDWETAGWGVPVVDLAQFTVHSLSPNLAMYFSAVSPCWTDETDLAPFARIGNIFRLVAAASWETDILLGPWVEHSMAKMKFYLAGMAASLQTAGWGE